MQKVNISSATPGSPTSRVAEPVSLANKVNAPARAVDARFGQWHWKLLICLGLLALTAAVYWPVYRFEFINYDDPEYVSENVRLQMGLTAENVGWAFRTYYFENWHPITWLSYIVDYQLFGLNSGAFHL